MYFKHITPFAAAVVAVLLASGCDQREPDCGNPRNQEERQQCAHKASTESRIAPTEQPKNWLELTDPTR